jgi:hypothetical protein
MNTNNINFSQWFFEFANYGFQRKNSIEQPEQNSNEAPPYKMFNVEAFFEELKSLVTADKKNSVKSYHEELGWIDNGSIIDVNINPFGSFRITTRKSIKDLKGVDTRICKSVFDITDRALSRMERNNIEVNMANKVYDNIKEFNQNNIDYAKKEYDNLKKLSQELFNATKVKHPDYIMFPVKMLEMNNNYYKLIFEFRGAGQGSPNRSISRQFDIDLTFDKEKGLLKCWGYEVNGKVKKNHYYVQPSEWNEYFSPQENNKKIISMIVTTFMTY